MLVNQPLFQIRQLKYRHILFIDELAIPQRKITCIVGESGSGKTTLLRMLNHMISPDSGDIEISGRSVYDWDPIELRRNVVMLSQTPVMFPGTVRDNLIIGLRFAGRAPVTDARLEKMLKRVRLNKGLDAESASLSGGEKQRVSLARILLLDPPVLLLDEPTSALDEETTRFIMERLTGYARQEKKTVVMVTHSSAVVRDYAEYVIEIKSGHVVKEGERHDRR
ncbi:ATP-binding cassette domain-containing protein [Sporolactobacillus sp. THM7-7]|nr:ATP-binding cassette domain-containing protein [Sporolactobacillus sp. THM7-7]